MFSYNTFIDNVQSAKRYFVATYITDLQVRETWYEYIDKQTAFVKQAVKTNELMAKKLQNLKF
jgi:hypothetical protein